MEAPSGPGSCFHPRAHDGLDRVHWIARPRVDRLHRGAANGLTGSRALPQAGGGNHSRAMLILLAPEGAASFRSSMVPPGHRCGRPSAARSSWRPGRPARLRQRALLSEWLPAERNIAGDHDRLRFISRAPRGNLGSAPRPRRAAAVGAVAGSAVRGRRGFGRRTPGRSGVRRVAISSARRS